MSLARLLVCFSDVVWQRFDALLLLELFRRLWVLPFPVRHPVALRKVDDVDVDSLKRQKEKSKWTHLLCKFFVGTWWVETRNECH